MATKSKAPAGKPAAKAKPVAKMPAPKPALKPAAKAAKPVPKPATKVAAKPAAPAGPAFSTEAQQRSLTNMKQFFDRSTSVLD
jgi:hypothetical protein